MDEVRNHIRRAPHGWRKASEFDSFFNPSTAYAPTTEEDDFIVATGIEIEPNYRSVLKSRGFEGGIEVRESHPNAEVIKQAQKEADEREPLYEYVDGDQINFPEWRAALRIPMPEDRNKDVVDRDTIRIYFDIGPLKEVCASARGLMKQSSDIEEIIENGINMIDEKYRFFEEHRRFEDIDRQRICVPEDFGSKTKMVAVTEVVHIDDIRAEKADTRDEAFEAIETLEQRIQNARESVEDLELGRIK